MSIKGGNVYLPDSSIPFKPLNPWGRAMPKPSREMKRVKPSLYQVNVTTRTGAVIPVGPQLTLKIAERFCEAIGVMIAKGKEKEWSDPTIVELREPAPDTRTLGNLLRA